MNKFFILNKVNSLNNRDLAIVIGVFLGGGIAFYGVFFNTYIIAPIFGHFYKDSLFFKLLAIILGAGTFGNLFSYVGSCIDIITNHKTIFYLFNKRG